ncbi:MAG: ABC transporter permease [Lentimicrobiaceae bacterium]|nr:ABC transporter permease [Lentimicrobiaceae bacterium]
MNDIIKIICSEFKAIGTNIPILIVLILGNVGYGFLYNLMYNTNVYREAPIAVVDMSQSDVSRHFIDYIDATQQVDVVMKTQDFHHAKQKLKEREIIGFLYIPSDLRNNIMRGEQTECTIYGSTLSFLDYLNISEAVNFASLKINSELLPEMIKSLNMIDVLFLANDKAVNIVSEPLYNSTEGYGTYLIPPVMVIIIFQTMMITMAMRIGGETVNKTTRPIVNKSYKIVLGKAITNVMIYIVFSVFFLGLLPLIFHLPHLGNFWDIAIMMIPYLFASAFFCMCLKPFFTDADMPLFLIVFMSVPLVFLTGISYPLELMPWHWKIFHYLIPVAPATMAFVKIDCMGGDLSNASPEMITLWIQCVVYFVIATLIWRHKKVNEPIAKS